MNTPPMPFDFFEGYISRVVSTMDRGGQSAYVSAVDELINFHGFFLRASRCQSQRFGINNYAKIPQFFYSTYEKWNHRYNDIYERAASLIDFHPDFFITATGIPFRLIDQCGDEMSSEILSNILLFYTTAFHRLEDWWGLKVSSQAGYLPNIGQPAVLSGFDSQRYERLVRSFVGDFENVSYFAGKFGNFSKINNNEEDEWSNFENIKEYVLTHLRSAAYILSVSVWKGDVLAAKLFSDALLRWYSWYEFQLTEGLFGKTELLNMGVLSERWSDVKKSVEECQPEYWEPPLPKAVLRTILDHALIDHIILVCAIFVSWGRSFQAAEIWRIEYAGRYFLVKSTTKKSIATVMLRKLG